MAGDVVSEEKKKLFTLEEVAKHTTHDDCWLIIGNQSNGTTIVMQQGSPSALWR